MCRSSRVPCACGVTLTLGVVVWLCWSPARAEETIPTVMVPRVVGTTAASARDVLKNAGLQAEFVLGPAAPSKAWTHRVCQQVPLPGTKLPGDSTATLTIYDEVISSTEAPPASDLAEYLLARVVVNTSQHEGGEFVDPQSGRLMAGAMDLAQQAGPRVIPLSRAFQFQTVRPGLLGIGWRLNWEKRILVRPDQALVVDGATVLLLEPSGRQAAGPATQTQVTIYRGRNGETLHRLGADGWQRTRIDGATERYSKSGQLLSTQLAGGLQLTFSYDDQDRLRRMAGPFGIEWRFQLDDAGRLRRVETATGVIVDYYYGNQATEAEHATWGQATRYEYDVDGLLIGVDDPVRGTRQVTYDADGRVVRLVGRAGVWTYAYNPSAGTIHSTSPDGTLAELTLGPHEIRQHEVTPDGHARTSLYDDERRLVSVTDADGTAVRYAYDDLGRRTETSTADGYGEHVEYVENTRLPQRVTYGDGTVRDYTYDLKLRLTRLAAGKETLWEAEYDADGLLVRERQGESESQYQYDKSGNVTRITDAAGHATGLQYDVRGNLVRQVDALGQETRFGYDLLDRLTRRIDPDGQETRFEYTGGRLVALHEAAGETRFEYDTEGRVVRVQTPAGEIRYTYDAFGRLHEQSDPGGLTTTHEYDAVGRLVRLEQSTGAAWQLGYDAWGRLQQLTGPLDFALHMEYDEAGRLAARRDALGRTTRYQYDAFGRLATEVAPDGIERQFEYDRAGRLVAQTGPAGRVELQADAQGRTTGFTLAGQAALQLEYEHGRPSAIRGPAGSRIQLTRNAVGQTTAVAYAGGERYTYHRDALGRVTAAADADGNGWKAEYTTWGQLRQLTQPDGGVFRVSYCKFGAVAQLIDARGHITHLEHDARGRRTAVTDPLARRTELQYGPGDQLVAIRGPDGHSTRLEHDLLGRPARIVREDGSRTEFQYDACGRLIAEQAGDYRATYEYNAVDRCVVAHYEPAGITVRQAFDSARRRTRLEVSGIGVWQYAYDRSAPSDRPKSVTLPNGTTLHLQYDEAGRLTALQLPDGHVIRREYDPRGRLASLQLTDADNHVVLVRTHHYSPAGNLARQVREDGTTTDFQYDATGRLIGWQWEHNGAASNTPPAKPARVPAPATVVAAADSGTKDNTPADDTATDNSAADRPAPVAGRAIKLVSDLVGNLAPEGVTVEFDDADQLLRWEDEQFRYNAHGSLVERQSAAATVHYEYDDAQHLARIRRGSETVAEYTYDPAGRRVSKRSGGHVTNYVYVDDRLLAELDGQGRALRVYTPGSRPHEVLCYTAGARTCYPVQDAVGTPVAVLDDSGALITLELDAFGLPRDAPSGPRLGGDVPIGHGGKLYDRESGLYQYGLRYYDPRLMRFLTADPVAGRPSNPPSLHRYQFCYDNPLRYRDPSGAAASDIADAIGEAGGSVGNSLGYCAGYLSGWAVSLPSRAYYHATGQTNKINKLDQALEEFSTEVTGRAGEMLGGFTASAVSDPLRFGSGAGEAQVDIQQGHYATAAWHAVQDPLRAVQAVTMGLGANSSVRNWVRPWGPKGPNDAIRVTQFYDPSRGTFGPGASRSLATPPNSGWAAAVDGPWLSSATTRTHVSAFPAAQQSWWTRMLTGRGTLRNYVEFDVLPSELTSIGGVKSIAGLGRYQHYLEGSVSLADRNPVFGALGINYGEYGAYGALAAAVAWAGDTLLDELDDPEPTEPSQTPASEPPSAATANAGGQLPNQLPADVRSALADLEQQLLADMNDPDGTRVLDQLQNGQLTTDQRDQLIDDRIRVRAQNINHQLQVAEQAAVRAQQHYNQLMQQQAQADQVRQAYQNWQRQQQAIQSLQQFGNLLNQAINSGNGGSGGHSHPGGSRPNPNPSRGTRQGGNAAGIHSLFQPVRDPTRAQQLQQTFGNRNKK